MLYAALEGPILEGAVALVPPQLVVAEVGQKDVDPAVVVIVGRRDADAVAVGPDPGRLRHIFEGERAGAVLGDHQIVAVETILEGEALLRRRVGVGDRLAGAQHLTLDQIEVEIAVVVVVQETNAGSADFNDIELAGDPREVEEVDA